jgi:glucose-1-phosphate thymidylyltransferase
VGGWYDCGKVETVLSTNLHLLEHGRRRRPEASDGVTLVDPVFVADGVTLHDCTIGPNVSIDAGAAVRGSTVRDAIIGPNAVVQGSTVEHSLLGDDSVITDMTLHNMVAARDEIAEAP